jgi:hypothetical protein
VFEVTGLRKWIAANKKALAEIQRKIKKQEGELKKAAPKKKAPARKKPAAKKKKK